MESHVKHFFMGKIHVARRQDPSRYASEIMAVWITRDGGTTPREPLRVCLDRSVLEHMGWQAGDTISLISEMDKGKPGEGKLIIRRAQHGEVALILPELPPNSVDSTVFLLESDDAVGQGPADMVGPAFEWCFPPDWVEMFFPGDYDPEEHSFNSQTEWSWYLSDLLGQSGQLELELSRDHLFLYLQRQGTSPTELTLHLVPGLLRLMNWNTQSDLILESESGFDPFGEEDTLVIREPSLGDEPDLLFSAGFWHCHVNPIWLNRYFPYEYDIS